MTGGYGETDLSVGRMNGASGATALLGMAFDDRPTNDLEDVIYSGLDDPTHRERVPGLVELLSDDAAPERERFLVCVALTSGQGGCPDHQP